MTACGDPAVPDGHDITGVELRLFAAGRRAGHQQLEHHEIPAETAVDQVIADVRHRLEEGRDRCANGL
jgi:hypothetical protein